MKNLDILILIFIIVGFSSCFSYSGSEGVTGSEIYTVNESRNQFDLIVAPNGITYTIDISTEEGRGKLKGLTLEEAKNMVLQEAAINNNCARIISPKFSWLVKKGHVIRITVFGFPAKYRNAFAR